jgi:XTP/dITP diphosphohydrolase
MVEDAWWIKMAEIIFVTGNRHKVEEASLTLSKYGIRVKMTEFKKVEIQSESLEEIAGNAAQTAANALSASVISEDSGLFISALAGFPGPYSSYVFMTIGCMGILRLMSSQPDKRAQFRCVVAYCAPGAKPILFAGTSLGTISNSMRGHWGFGFDPIFVPSGKDARTFAEMTTSEKEFLSHRGAAFRSFGQWYEKTNPPSGV